MKKYGQYLKALYIKGRNEKLRDIKKVSKSNFDKL